MKIYNLDRKNPYKYFEDFTELDNAVLVNDSVSLACDKGEFFVIQLVLLSESESENVTIETSKNITCFNTEGNSKFGKPFTRSLTVSNKAVQPLYFGIDTEKENSDVINGEITVCGNEKRTIKVTVTQTGETVEKHGYGDLWRLSRLNWLNSDLARDNKATDAYIPVSGNANEVKILGRKLTFGDDCQLQNVESYFDESVLLCDTVQKKLLSKPFEFNITGEDVKYGKPTYTQDGDCAVLTNKGESENLTVDVECQIKYEGMLEYVVTLEAKNDCEFQNISLSSVFTHESSLYNNGLDKWGGSFENVYHKWNHWRQDCMFVGSINCGARVKWKDADYRRPFTLIYYPNREIVIPQDTWANNDKGVVICERTNEGALLETNTSKYSMKKGDVKRFCYQIHITPFTPVDYKKHYSTRYLHSSFRGFTVDEIIAKAKETKSNYIIVHHGSIYNPYINYPFIADKYLKPLIEAVHKEGIGIKLYYTLREHGIEMAELFPYKSFGDEIIYYNKDAVYCEWPEGKDPLFVKYLGEEAVPAWRVLFNDGPFAGRHDVSFLVNPDTRLDNYYIEGLKWLVENLDIDGIYIDDTALDRTTFERARKIIESKKGKFERFIDMHTCNHHLERNGKSSCINMYTELLPFVDDFWIGEEFYFDEMTPDSILCENTALPYGKASSMLEGSDGKVSWTGNLWMGMIFALSCRNRAVPSIISDGIYQIWDDFQIQDSLLLGYWHSKTPFKTNDKDVLVSTYKKDDEALVCVCNFGNDEREITISCDEKLLGFKPGKVEKVQINNFQDKGDFDWTAKQTVKAKEGIVFKVAK